MKFQHSTSYAASPADVFAMLTDAEFREAAMRQMRTLSYDVDVQRTGDTADVTIEQTQAVRKIPDFAKKLVGEEIRIVQRETWTSPTGGEIEITVPGKPGVLRGTIALAASGSGTTQTIAGDLKVSIPLIGGKIEAVMADMMKLAMQAEGAAGARWLAGER